MNIGVSVPRYIGIGDGMQFTSLPENYFMGTGRRLIDVSKPWFFDHNPYIDRTGSREPDKVIDLWNFPNKWEWPKPRMKPEVYVTNAEIWASLLDVSVVLNRPRLYQFEHFPFEMRHMILFHTHGRSHGNLPDHVIDHVITKYKKTNQLFHIGLESDPDLGIPRIKTPNLWSLVELISKSKLFIGVDSGPSWIAACFPDIMIKKIRNRPVHGEKSFMEWVPLERDNIHSHWDDRTLFQIFHGGEQDMNFMSSYTKL